MTQLTLIRGLPGSGKSTLAKQLAYNRGWHFEADMFFIDADGVYNWSADKIGEAHRWCQRSTHFRLSCGNSVFVSNTFTTIKELEPYFGIALDHGITPIVITLHNQWGNVHDVPPETIEKMRARFVYDLSDLMGRHQINLERKMNV